MEKQLIWVLSGLFLFCSGAVWADNATPVATIVAVMPSGTSTPTAPPKKKKKKKAFAVTTPTASSTPGSQTSVSPTPQGSPAPAGKSKTQAVSTPTPMASGANGPSAGDEAYAAKDYTKAMSVYSEEIQKKGKNPDLEKKYLLAKFYAGQVLEDEARKGLKSEENYYKSDEESHNLAVYGKRQPSRGAHLVTLSLAILTPQLLGGDIGFTFLSHINVGCGIGFMGFDPRVKYYFDGDNASFFLGMGYAIYNFNLSGNFSFGSGNGNFSGTLSGNFLHFTFGPSFQDKNGIFMEVPFDVGVANFTGSGNANGSGTVSGGGGSANVSGGGSGSGSYNGIMGTVGFRFGYSI